MKATDDRLRVVIAVTETSPVPALWRAAMSFVRETPADLVALFVDDERWRHAASLPFTREVSRISGSVADFTTQRAEQVNKEAVTKTRRRIEQLASQAELAFAFEVLAESDQRRIEELAASGKNVLIAPTFMTRRPICAHFTRYDCRVLLIETPE